MKVALIGTGLMGGPMGERLIESGHDLVVYNRTGSKTRTLEELGAVAAASPSEAIASAELTLLMLSDAPAIREALEPHGRFPDLSGRSLCQMGTIAPRESIALLEDVRRAGGEYFEAPVLGSRPQARDGSLIVMVGATPEQYERWLEVLECMGTEPRLIGKVGQAAALKLAFNQMIGSQLVGFATALALVRHHDIDSEELMTQLRKSALYAPAFDAKLPRLLSGEFENPNFPARLLLKDLELARGLAAEVGLETDALEGLCRLVEKAMDQGKGDYDYSVVGAVIDPHRT